MALEPDDHFLAIDLGGTWLRVARVRGGAVAIARREPTPRGGPDEVVAAAARMAGALGGPPAAACGVAAPGPLDPRRGLTHELPNLPGWRGFPLAAALEEVLGLPVAVHNDASLAALGEARRGAGRGARVVVYLTLSTGVGGGIVVDGRLYEGAHGLAGELGHLVVDPGGAACGAGHVGCLEALASGPALAAAAARRVAAGEASALGREPRAAEVVAAARGGDALARAVLAAAAAGLGRALAAWINAFDPDLVVVGGGVARGAWDELVAPAAAAAPAWIMSPAARAWRLEAAALGDDAGLIGAAEWAHAVRSRGRGDRGGDMEEAGGLQCRTDR